MPAVPTWQTWRLVLQHPAERYVDIDNLHHALNMMIQSKALEPLRMTLASASA